MLAAIRKGKVGSYLMVWILPPLKAQLQAEAKRNARSMSGEVRYMVETTLAAREQARANLAMQQAVEAVPIPPPPPDPAAPPSPFLAFIAQHPTGRP
jgi:hypothetical protein